MGKRREDAMQAIVLVYLCDDNAIGPNPEGPSYPSLEKSMVVSEEVHYSVIRRTRNLSYPSSSSSYLCIPCLSRRRFQLALVWWVERDGEPMRGAASTGCVHVLEWKKFRSHIDQSFYRSAECPNEGVCMSD